MAPDHAKTRNATARNGKSGTAKLGNAKTGPVKAGLVKAGLVKAGLVKPDNVKPGGVKTGKTGTSRAPRADSRRNQQRLIEAATQVFSAGGPQASLEAVARQAGVGIGTLYRHFPTREALFEAVYRHEVDHLADLAEGLARGPDTVEALRKWLQSSVRLVAAKKGMIEGLQLVAHGSSELKTYSFDRLTTAVGLLLQRAVAAGKIRADIPPEDLLRTLFGIFYSQGTTDWHPNALRLVDVFVDGLIKH